MIFSNSTFVNGFLSTFAFTVSKILSSPKALSPPLPTLIIVELIVFAFEICYVQLIRLCLLLGVGVEMCVVRVLCVVLQLSGW